MRAKKDVRNAATLWWKQRPYEADTLIRKYIEQHFGGDTKAAVADSIKKAANHFLTRRLLGDKYAHMKVERYLHSQLRCPFYTEEHACYILPGKAFGV